MSPGARPLPSDPVLHVEPLDAAELAFVVGDQGRAQRKSVRRDEGVERSHGPASLFEVKSDFPVGGGRTVVER